MKKSIAFIILAVLGFSGCAPHKRYVGPATEKSYDSNKVKKGELISVSAKYQQGDGMLPGDNGIESVYFAFQLAAEDTLRNGKKFFAIYRPIAISDFEGKGFGSPEAFRDKCIRELGPGASAIAKQAQYNNSYCGTTQVLTTHLEIVEYGEKPDGMTVYDANKTIAMIKQDGYFTEGNIKAVQSPSHVGDIRAMGFTYDTWFASKRSDPREAGQNNVEKTSQKESK